MKDHLSTQDWQLLSDYLDDQLLSDQKSRFEQRLLSSPNLQMALEEIRRTRTLLRKAPRRRVPHNFTLTPTMLQQKVPISLSLVPIFSITSALAGVMTILLMIFEFLPGYAAQPTSLMAPAAPVSESVMQKEVEESPMDISATSEPYNVPGMVITAPAPGPRDAALTPEHFASDGSALADAETITEEVDRQSQNTTTGNGLILDDNSTIPAETMAPVPLLNSIEGQKPKSNRRLFIIITSLVTISSGLAAWFARQRKKV